MERTRTARCESEFTPVPAADTDMKSFDVELGSTDPLQAQGWQPLTRMFRIGHDRQVLPELISELVRIGRECAAISEAEAVRVSVALEEALLNAIVHGNLEVSSDLRDRMDDAYEREINVKRRTNPFCQRQVTIRISTLPGWIRYEVEDEGPGFCVADVPDPREDDRLTRPCGRGILLMRAFLDSVTYNARGNRVTLTKHSAVCAPVL